MRYNKPTNVQDVLEDSYLGKILQKGIQLQQINEMLEKSFHHQFKGFYRVANFSQYEITIEVANGMVRQGLLFKEQELLTLVRQIYPKIQKVQFKVNPTLLSIR